MCLLLSHFGVLGQRGRHAQAVCWREMDEDDEDAIFLQALEEAEQQRQQQASHQALQVSPHDVAAREPLVHDEEDEDCAFLAALAQAEQCSLRGQDARQHDAHDKAPQDSSHRQPLHQEPTRTHPQQQCGNAQPPGGRGVQRPPPPRQQQRITFTPSGGGRAPARPQPSLLAENALNLQHDRAVQERCKVAARVQQQGKEKQEKARQEASRQDSTLRQDKTCPGHSTSGGGSARPSSTQRLLHPKAPALHICPASLLEPYILGGASLSAAGLNFESAKTLYMPSFGREYQRVAIQSAVLCNTLVSLPTGMGKTFVAAVVMFNYLRWFPNKIVVFLAPTKPLAKQQVDSVYQVVGIPPEMTTLMTGDLAPELRKARWQTHRVFFMTPQVFENDVSNRICDASRVALVVVDEAHKAVGQHSIVKALNYLHDCHIVSDSTRASVGFRVLALTATPGTKVEAVQQVLTNCFISKVEARTEHDDDVKAYLPHKIVATEIVPPNSQLTAICNLLREVIAPVLSRLVFKRAIQQYQGGHNPFILRVAQQKFISNPPQNLSKSEMQSIIADFCAAYFLKCQLRDVERNSVLAPLKNLRDSKSCTHTHSFSLSLSLRTPPPPLPLLKI